MGKAADEHPGDHRFDGTYAGDVLCLLPDQCDCGGVVYGRRRDCSGIPGFVCSDVRIRQAERGPGPDRQAVIKGGKRCRSVVYSLITPTP